MAKAKKEKAAAIVTIRRAKDMSPRGRKDIAAWLQMHAKHILKHGDNYSPRFTGRFIYN